jgi:superfamily II DNA/RNA helicase
MACLEGDLRTVCKTWEQSCAGRIKDLVESGKLRLSAVKYFILDEADRLLDTGNQELILDLFSRFPKAGTGAARLQVFCPALAP